MKLKACTKIKGDSYSPEAESDTDCIHKKFESFDNKKSNILVQDKQSFESIITSK